jgi:amino acid transporter
MGPDRDNPETPARLGLWDAVSLIIGIIIGVGIFETPGRIQAPGPYAALAVWFVGGLVALIGAFCFAELAAAYPRSGGEYVYLNRAFGPSIGFLFAWAQLAVIRPAGIALLAYIFGDYASRLWHFDTNGVVLLAVLAIVVLTAINVLGVVFGKSTQNVLSLAKLLGLAAIALAAFVWGRPGTAATATVQATDSFWFASAMVLVLWTYAGWHEAAYVTAEVKNKRRYVPLALMLGTGAVTLTYVLLNAAYLWALGFSSLSATKTPATDVARLLPGSIAVPAVLLLVMISALGATNGMIFTTARIFAVFGADHRLFAPLGHWSSRLGTPARALLWQGILSVVYVVIVGLIWASRDSFEGLVGCTAAVFWMFFLLTGIALFVLRYREPHIIRPFRTPGYPILPALFCVCCGYMVLASILFERLASLVGLVIVLAGLPLYFMPKKHVPQRPTPATLVVRGQAPVSHSS